MPLNPLNFHHSPIHKGPDILGDIMRGFKLGRMPHEARQSSEAHHENMRKQMIDNAFREQYGEEELQSNIALNRARADHYNRPQEQDLGEMGKLVQGYLDAKSNRGEEDELTKLWKSALQNKADGGQGTQLTVDPNTGVISYSQGGRSRNAQGGQQVINGNVVSPPTQAVTTEQQSRQISNIARDYLSGIIRTPYIGSGSNAKLFEDWNKYSSTKKAKEKKEIGDKLVDAAVAQKLVPEMVLQQLNSQGTKSTIAAQREQRKAVTQGWPEIIEYISRNLPPELQKEAQRRHDEILAETAKAQTSHYVKGLPFPVAPQGSNSSRPASEYSIEELEAIANGE